MSPRAADSKMFRGMRLSTHFPTEPAAARLPASGGGAGGRREAMVAVSVRYCAMIGGARRRVNAAAAASRTR